MKEQLKELNLRYLQLAKAGNDYSIADLETELTDQVLDLMNQHGYAKLATDQTLPFRSDSTGMGLTCAEERTTKQMWRAGWRKVELEGRSTLSEQPLQIIGVPKDPIFAWNLIDMKTNMLLACEHPVPDSALCSVCRAELLSNAREIIHNVVEKNGKWVQE